MKRILVLGAEGQVGWELRRALLPLGNVLATNRSQLNLADADRIEEGLEKMRPDLVVNAAAYTAVDRAESEPAVAMTVNGTAPGILAQWARRTGVPLVHYSTDYVFDGRASRPYVEEDVPNPLSVYGATKLAGEAAVRQAGCAHLMLRTSWVYGARGRNFLLTIRRLATEREEIGIVADQIGAPTWARAIAEATASMLAQCWLGRPREAFDAVTGTYHLTAAGAASWYEFAEAILRLPNSRMRQVTLKRISTEEYPTAAVRPKNSRLSNAKIERVFGITLPDWQTQLSLCMDDLSTA